MEVPLLFFLPTLKCSLYLIARGYAWSFLISGMREIGERRPGKDSIGTETNIQSGEKEKSEGLEKVERTAEENVEREEGAKEEMN